MTLTTAGFSLEPALRVCPMLFLVRSGPGNRGWDCTQRRFDHGVDVLGVDAREQVQTMTAYIVQVSLGDTPNGTLEYRTIFAVGLSLFVMTLFLNAISHRMRSRILKGGAM